MQKNRRLIGIWVCASIITALASMNTRAGEAQQINISATPASIILPSPLPLMTEAISTPTATYTATPAGPVLLEALTEANVRAKPDPESDLLGTIHTGDVYPVLGRYYRWYQFQYNKSASGTGWVFDDLVKITGDETQILDLSENALPTVDNTAVAATDAMSKITQTPGGILTVTAASQIIPLPVQPIGTPGAGSSQTTPDTSLLPTFTYPPEVALVPPDSAFRVGTPVEATPTLTSNGLTFSVTEGVAPIVPILILGGLGLLGLIVSSVRR